MRIHRTLLGLGVVVLVGLGVVWQIGLHTPAKRWDPPWCVTEPSVKVECCGRAEGLVVSATLSRPEGEPVVSFALAVGDTAILESRKLIVDLLNGTELEGTIASVSERSPGDGGFDVTVTVEDSTALSKPIIPLKGGRIYFPDREEVPVEVRKDKEFESVFMVPVDAIRTRSDGINFVVRLIRSEYGLIGCDLVPYTRENCPCQNAGYRRVERRDYITVELGRTFGEFVEVSGDLYHADELEVPYSSLPLASTSATVPASN